MPRARNKPSIPGVRSVSPATIRRIRNDALEAATDARRGHELGRLALREIQHPGEGITAIQESVGLRYAGLRAKWRAVTGISPASVQAQDIGRVRGAAGEAPDEIAASVERAMRDADDALGAPSSPQRRAVEIVCDRDCVVVGHQMLLDLRLGLDALARLWGVVR